MRCEQDKRPSTALSRTWQSGCDGPEGHGPWSARVESKLGRTGSLGLGLGSLLGPELLPSQARDLASLEPPQSSRNPQPIRWSQASTQLPALCVCPRVSGRPGLAPAQHTGSAIPWATEAGWVGTAALPAM